MIKKLLLLPATIFLALSTWGQSTVLWNESINGPAGATYATPTDLGSLFLGTNSIIGVTESEYLGGSWGVYPDFYTFTVPVGTEVSEVFLTVDRQILAWLGDPLFSTRTAFNEPGKRGFVATVGVVEHSGGELRPVQ